MTLAQKPLSHYCETLPSPTSNASSRISISGNHGKLSSRSTHAPTHDPAQSHSTRINSPVQHIIIISLTMFFRALTALLAAAAATSSPLAARDAGPECTIVVTPKDSSYAAGAANQLTYGSSSKWVFYDTISYNHYCPGFLYRFGQSTYPDGTSVTSTSVSPVHRCNRPADALHVARLRPIRKLERRRNLHRRYRYHCDGSDFRSNRDDHRGAMARDVGLGRFQPRI
ncbi:uncharacterized protein EV420DRAFT_1181551 [Desarmillaria tabescens]|uniref:Uncharacterized protein n=1 Tax=Armillaria tabescens TaxID=1929756 RepID=A0AA39NB24_ARMTA|nr:uncharacterized protein EV420DRAFT_1181551 [Desarmillaria tabescens]KAK0462333.1 hypothetical protein EV420DRAFT_1181551 [Desarmillaria tabescens]